MKNDQQQKAKRSPEDKGYQNNIKYKKHIGRISSLSENEDFGFITYNEGENLFFHISSASEKLHVGDSVVFSVRLSKRYKNKQEAFRVHKVYRQATGPSLILSDIINFLPGSKEQLLELMGGIIIRNNGDEPAQETILEYKLENTYGKTFACETTILDDIFYAKRKNKKGYSRFAKNKQPGASALFTIIIRFRQGFHQVVASYFGPKTPAEPWDRIASPESLDFWRNHALIPDDAFQIDYTTIRHFDPDFFKSFEEIQGQGANYSEDNQNPPEIE
jgi:cold shock CspA family protein